MNFQQPFFSERLATSITETQDYLTVFCKTYSKMTKEQNRGDSKMAARGRKQKECLLK
jgi:hypothetical protein